LSRALLISTNGTGLGHLTRSMAIARRLSAVQPLLLTTSQAIGVAREQGFLCEYFPSQAAGGPGGPVQWEDRLQRRLGELIEAYEPSVLVFDGVSPYWGLLGALDRTRGLASVWCRRPLWRPGYGEEKLRLSSAFDAVLEPGELAAEEDRGATVARREEAVRVDPILYLDREELLAPDRAAAELGLDPGSRAALVHLGAGPRVEATIAACVERLAREPDLQVAVLASAISPALSLPQEVKVLEATYPISRLYRAFEFAVSAAGYNAFHELFQADVPALWVPMPRETDDQAARARHAARVGAGASCESLDGAALDTGLERMLDRDEREGMRGALAGIAVGNGAGGAAALVGRLVGGTS
jgi:UDP:flavonoid glycosyltransferase YjiC (YdhE family)